MENDTPLAPTVTDDVVHGATWNGVAPADLGEGRTEYRSFDGTTFIVDPAAGVRFGAAQSGHVLAALAAAGLVADRLEDSA